MRNASFALLGLVLLAGLSLAQACGSDQETGSSSGSGPGSQSSSGSPEQTGSVCKVPADCYPDVDSKSLHGEVQCLTRVRGGYCTHLCESDADCCAVPGECVTGLKQVCSPFESTGQKMCFLSCEKDDIVAPDGGAPPADEQVFCQEAASHDFICRSSGGGSQNRKVCVPGDCGVGAACALDADCSAGLVCVTSFDGGYCAERDCKANADCPMGSLCVTAGGANYCMRSCATESDCSFCRFASGDVSCSPDATFVEASSLGSVCLPP